MPSLDARFKTAASHFDAFFRELGSSFIEREEILTQLALALLSREHALMTGPPGTAKSQLASAVLRRILDESTGLPSVFARQFTESTVQTDLIGPIDFKTLVETGRTEHFTDEGMLGAVHAFLDEVLDGRDMLLRSTLNLMLERELKQGSKTSRGAIECAFMTSNRYVAEILETSRDTLLAFVDRVAFVGFVPRGFATSDSLREVVRRHAGGFKPAPLSCALTIQDLDVLQAAADEVFVSNSVCDAVVKLVEDLDTELAEASRADAAFIPTRYLSTRSIVRAARVLRAAVVYDKITGSPERELEVTARDLPLLRLHLLLGGVTADRASKRLARETDPRERRQLEIVRIEREIFDRCIKRLPAIERSPRPSIDVARLRMQVEHATLSGETKPVIDLVPALAKAAASGAKGADDANEMLKSALGSVTRRALSKGLTPELHMSTGVKTLLDSLAALAEQIDGTSKSARTIAFWLRGRALAFSDEACVFGPPTDKATIDERLAVVEEHAALRALLAARGTDPPISEHSKETWRRFVDRFADDLAPLADAELLSGAKNVVAKPHARLAEALADLMSATGRISAIDVRLSALGGRSLLKQRVLLPRIGPLLDTVFDRIQVPDRRDLMKEVQSIHADLVRARVADAIPPKKILELAASAILRTAKPLPKPSQLNEFGFTSLRIDLDVRSATDALLEIAIDLLAQTGALADHPGEAAKQVYGAVQSIDAALRAQVIALDCSALAAQLDYLQHWWVSLGRNMPAIEKSGFLRVARTGGGFVALSLEARTLEETFGKEAADASLLRARVEQLDMETSRVIASLRQAETDEAWSKTISPKQWP